MAFLRPGVYRKIIELHTQAHMAQRAIAGSLRISRNTVRRALDRVRRGLSPLPPTNDGKLYRNRQLEPRLLRLLLAIVKREPRLYIDEIQAKLQSFSTKKLSWAAVQRALKRSGVSKKLVRLIFCPDEDPCAPTTS